MGFESNLNNNAVRKKEAAQKTKRGIFSPLICGEAGGGGEGTNFPRLKLSEALWGQLWGEAGKEKEGELATTSSLWNLNCPSNRGEKSLRHVAMIAKFLDDNKTKMPLKK